MNPTHVYKLPPPWPGPRPDSTTQQQYQHHQHQQSPMQNQPYAPQSNPWQPQSSGTPQATQSPGGYGSYADNSYQQQNQSPVAYQPQYGSAPPFPPPQEHYQQHQHQQHAPPPPPPPGPPPPQQPNAQQWGPPLGNHHQQSQPPPPPPARPQSIIYNPANPPPPSQSNVGIGYAPQGGQRPQSQYYPQYQSPTTTQPPPPPPAVQVAPPPPPPPPEEPRFDQQQQPNYGYQQPPPPPPPPAQSPSFYEQPGPAPYKPPPSPGITLAEQQSSSFFQAQQMMTDQGFAPGSENYAQNYGGGRQNSIVSPMTDNSSLTPESANAPQGWNSGQSLQPPSWGQSGGGRKFPYTPPVVHPDYANNAQTFQGANNGGYQAPAQPPQQNQQWNSQQQPHPPHQPEQWNNNAYQQPAQPQHQQQSQQHQGDWNNQQHQPQGEWNGQQQTQQPQPPEQWNQPSQQQVEQWNSQQAFQQQYQQPQEPATSQPQSNVQASGVYQNFQQQTHTPTPPPPQPPAIPPKQISQNYQPPGPPPASYQPPPPAAPYTQAPQTQAPGPHYALQLPQSDSPFDDQHETQSRYSPSPPPQHNQRYENPAPAPQEQQYTYSTMPQAIVTVHQPTPPPMQQPTPDPAHLTSATVLGGDMGAWETFPERLPAEDEEIPTPPESTSTRLSFENKTTASGNEYQQVSIQPEQGAREPLPQQQTEVLIATPSEVPSAMTPFDYVSSTSSSSSDSTFAVAPVEGMSAQPILTVDETTTMSSNGSESIVQTQIIVEPPRKEMRDVGIDAPVSEPPTPRAKTEEEEQMERIDQLEPFFMDSISRYVNMIEAEAAATDDKEKLKLFQEFMEAEYFIRGQRYATALTMMSHSRPSTSATDHVLSDDGYVVVEEEDESPQIPDIPELVQHSAPLPLVGHPTGQVTALSPQPMGASLRTSPPPSNIVSIEAEPQLEPRFKPLPPLRPLSPFPPPGGHGRNPSQEEPALKTKPSKSNLTLRPESLNRTASDHGPESIIHELPNDPIMRSSSVPSTAPISPLPRSGAYIPFRPDASPEKSETLTPNRKRLSSVGEYEAFNFQTRRHPAVDRIVDPRDTGHGIRRAGTSVDFGPSGIPFRSTARDETFLPPRNRERSEEFFPSLSPDDDEADAEDYRITECGLAPRPPTGKPPSPGEAKTAEALRNLLFVLPPQGRLNSGSSALLSDFQKKLATQPEDFKYIHDATSSFEEWEKNERTKLEDQRRKRQDEHQEYIDELFAAEKIGYGDIGEMDDEFNAKEGGISERAEKAIYDKYCMEVFTPIYDKVQNGIKCVMDLKMEVESLLRAAGGGKTRWSEGSMPPVEDLLSLMIKIEDTVENRQSRVSEAVRGRDRKYSKSVMGPLKAKDDFKKMKAMERHFEDSEKKAILAAAQDRLARITSLNTTVSTALAPALEADLAYTATVTSAITAVTSSLTSTSSKFNRHLRQALDTAHKTLASIIAAAEELMKTRHSVLLRVNAATTGVARLEGDENAAVDARKRDTEADTQLRHEVQKLHREFGGGLGEIEIAVSNLPSLAVSHAHTTSVDDLAVPSVSGRRDSTVVVTPLGPPPPKRPSIVEEEEEEDPMLRKPQRVGTSFGEFSTQGMGYGGPGNRRSIGAGTMGGKRGSVFAGKPSEGGRLPYPL